MNDIAKTKLPQDLHLLQLPGFADPDELSRPNRVCICISDLHFTDGTVGKQSADEVIWEDVFESIMDICVNEEAEELHLILAGDVVDMIRSSQWEDARIYPWDREREEYHSSPGFKKKYDDVLRKIMQGIVDLHAPADEKSGFFSLLKRLPRALEQYDYKNNFTGTHKQSRIKRVSTLALLGNHDKEVLVCSDVLKMFNERCLGHPAFQDEYCRWIGRMYFDDEKRFLGAGSAQAPWTPFYWADRGFRLFVTHGHWRDADNCRSIPGGPHDPSWNTRDGWNLKRWQNMGFSPFTRPCWGDSVVAALLSAFMIRSKRRLETLQQQLKAEGKPESEIEAIFVTIKNVLDEMDLYRPNASAIMRLQILTRELRKMGGVAESARREIEEELFNSLRAWLNMEFTESSAPPSVRWKVWLGRAFIYFLNLLNRWTATERIALGFAYFVVSMFESSEQDQRKEPTAPEMHAFTAFLDEYRQYGFRIHSEGHTHIPLQADLYFKQPDTPADRQNYTYVNFGTWRNQVKPTQSSKYRRFSVGRALVILDKIKPGTREREFGYYVQDLTNWSDKFDGLSRKA
ncbi:MAG TPA: hypothetical protein VIU46_01585 [Gallionellaceae bacterium]